MSFEMYEDLGNGITRIDSAMIHEELAACYLMGSEDEYALIETGTHNTVPHILALLSSRQIGLEQVKYVIPTHVHLDHAGGVGGLMQVLPNATLLIHPHGARHMINPKKLRAGAMVVYGEVRFKEIYGDVIAVDEARVRQMEEGDQVLLGSRTLTFYDTPGHARHHFCVHDSQTNGIFTGDTFGLAYPTLASAKGPFIFPTTTPIQFEPDELKHSIRKLLALKPDCMYLTHYGKVTHPAPLGQQLLAQIDDYVALGHAARQMHPPHALENALIEKLTEYTLARAREHECPHTETELRQILAMDMKLNAQGLMVWLG